MIFLSQLNTLSTCCFTSGCCSNTLCNFCQTDKMTIGDIQWTSIKILLCAHVIPLKALSYSVSVHSCMLSSLKIGPHLRQC